MDEDETKRLEWMTSISANVKTEDYMLGRRVDKTFELCQQEKIEKAREARIELVARDRIKLSHDPILDLERRRNELKMELISNPVKLRQFRERLLQMDNEKLSQTDVKINSDVLPGISGRLALGVGSAQERSRSPDRSSNRTSNNEIRRSSIAYEKRRGHQGREEYSLASCSSDNRDQRSKTDRNAYRHPSRRRHNDLHRSRHESRDRHRSRSSSRKKRR